MTPCIPTGWEGTGQDTESQEVTVGVRLDELIVHWRHKAAVFCTTLGAAWLADLEKLFSLVLGTDEAAQATLSSLEPAHCRGMGRNWRVSSRSLPL